MHIEYIINKQAHTFEILEVQDPDLEFQVACRVGIPRKPTEYASGLIFWYWHQKQSFLIHIVESPVYELKHHSASAVYYLVRQKIRDILSFLTGIKAFFIVQIFYLDLNKLFFFPSFLWKEKPKEKKS